LGRKPRSEGADLILLDVLVRDVISVLWAFRADQRLPTKSRTSRPMSRAIALSSAGEMSRPG
jgi:hypothetical protein